MAKVANKQAEKPEKESAEKKSKTPGKKAFFARFLTRKWLAILVGLTIGIQGIGFVYYRRIRKADPVSLSPEVSLGEFHFKAEKNEEGRIAKAEFSLHIALLDQIKHTAQHRLRDYKYRVQQDIEELLRQAHSGDFEDPTLGELKRQLQEQVNETLGMRAIADVIITDLKLEQREIDIQVVTDTAEAVPWVEKPAS